MAIVTSKQREETRKGKIEPKEKAV